MPGSCQGFLFKAFVTAVVGEGCDPAVLQRGVWVAVVVLQLLFWCQTCPGGAVTGCQWSGVLMGVGDGCNSQCWMCCMGKAGSRGAVQTTLPSVVTYMPAGTHITGFRLLPVGPRDLFDICVTWCFSFEEWVCSPCTSERMVVHTK